MKHDEIKRLLHTNLKIFKENIRLLFSTSIEEIWQNLTKTDFLNNFILKEMNKGKFEEIKEEFENNNSDSNSVTITNGVAVSRSESRSESIKHGFVELNTESHNVAETKSEEFKVESKNVNKLINSELSNKKNFAHHKSSNFFEKQDKASNRFDFDFESIKLNSISKEKNEVNGYLDKTRKNEKLKKSEKLEKFLHKKANIKGKRKLNSSSKEDKNRFSKRYSQKTDGVKVYKSYLDDIKADFVSKTNLKKNKRKSINFSTRRKNSQTNIGRRYLSPKKEYLTGTLNRRSAQTGEETILRKFVNEVNNKMKLPRENGKSEVSKSKSFMSKAKGKNEGGKVLYKNKFTNWAYPVKGTKKDKT